MEIISQIYSLGISANLDGYISIPTIPGPAPLIICLPYPPSSVANYMYLGNPESLEGPLDDVKFAHLNLHIIPLALSSKIINTGVGLSK